MLPEAPIPRDPAGGVPHGAGAQPAPAHPAVLRMGQEAGAFQHAEVLLDAGERDPKRLGELADGGVPGGEARENRAPRGIRERGEHAVEIGPLQMLNHMV
jgi:hypothetical protein